MTRNEKLTEIFYNKLKNKEDISLLGEDFQINGVIDSYWKDVVTIYNKNIGLVDVSFDNITSVI